VLLAACQGEQEPVEAQRFSLDAARHVPDAAGRLARIAGAAWSVTKERRRSRSAARDAAAADAGVRPCARAPAQFRIVRHVTARPGEKALLPVIGNGTISRFKVDATLRRWRVALGSRAAPRPIRCSTCSPAHASSRQRCPAAARC
jgi:hypothetical protein